jgi:hypothetical protein
MLVEGRSLTSGTFLEETNSPEIGFAYQLHKGLSGHGKNFTCQRRWEWVRSHDRNEPRHRVLAGEASRKAGCGKSARPV